MTAPALVLFWIGYVAFSASARSDFPWTRRRSHFGARFAFACLVGPVWLTALMTPLIVDPGSGNSALGGLIGITVLAWLPAAICAPALYFRRSSPAPGTTDDDEDDDGGSQPDRPPAGNDAPRGGIPLPDAEQGRTRLRDHSRPPRVETRRRRQAPERPPRAPRSPAAPR